MSLYQDLLFPILCKFDPEFTHDRTLWALALAQDHRLGQALLGWIAGRVPHRPVELFGLTFPNELGVAAGFDKDAMAIAGLHHLGFGHVEVGTLTPKPQIGNHKPRVFRLPEDKALINRMGFPNLGAVEASNRIRQSAAKRETMILGVSLGKQNETELQAAARDYLTVMERVHPYADYLAINISSPNTPGLRQLQGRAYLAQLLEALMRGNMTLAERNQYRPRPLLLKIAPDLSWPELDSILEVAEAGGISGIVACNTTTSRAGVRSRLGAETGGLSGSPLREKSNEIIKYIRKRCGERMPVIGVGGSMAASDVRRKLDLGASLVQMYTGLVYGGPGIAGRILRSL